MITKLPLLSKENIDMFPTIEQSSPRRRQRRFDRRNSKVGKMFFEAGYYLSSAGATDLELDHGDSADKATIATFKSNISPMPIMEMSTALFANKQTSELRRGSGQSCAVILEEQYNHPSLGFKRKTSERARENIEKLSSNNDKRQRS